MKKTYIIPIAETIKVSKMLMQSSVRSMNTNLGDKSLNYGGSETPPNTGARSDFFGGFLWDDEE